MLKVTNVDKNGVGYELGIEPGDEIVSFDGYEAEDLLDYLYYEGQEAFVVGVKRDGKITECEVEKYDDETLGLDFESDNLDIRLCHNNCIFCFVAQLPANMRPTLYVKDDDYRQSFLCGNYVTLTNLKKGDIDRIIRLNLSPLYISVHTTNGELRNKMLSNRFADRINDQLERLNAAGITMHTQIVLVKGVNDGKELEKTMEDIAKLENVKTLAVVPCGITGHRENLTKIENVDEKYSADIINTINSFNKKIGRTLVFAADDFYVRAHMPYENYEYYGDFEQIENGVGMMTKFIHDFEKAARKTTYRRTFLLVTGVAAESFIRCFAEKTMKYCEGLKLTVLAVKNEFFGESITCAGLVVGRDIIKAVKESGVRFDELCVPKIMLRDEGDAFLDDTTVSEVEEALGKKVRIIEEGGDGFFTSLTRKR